MSNDTQMAHAIPVAALPEGVAIDPRIEAKAHEIIAATAEARDKLHAYVVDYNKAVNHRDASEAALKAGDESVTATKLGNARLAVDRLDLLHTGARHRYNRASNAATPNPQAALTVAAALALDNLVPTPVVVALDHKEEVAEGDHTVVLLNGSIKVESGSPYVRLPDAAEVATALAKVGVTDANVMAVSSTEATINLKDVPEYLPVWSPDLDGSGMWEAFKRGRNHWAGPQARRGVHGVVRLEEWDAEGVRHTKLGVRVIEDGPSTKVPDLATVNFRERRAGEKVYAGALNEMSTDVAGINSAGRIIEVDALDTVPDWVTKLPPVEVHIDHGRADRWSSASKFVHTPEHIAYLEVATVALPPVEVDDDTDDDVYDDVESVESVTANREVRARADADREVKRQAAEEARENQRIASAALQASLMPPPGWNY